MESGYRSLFKAITWRLFGIVFTFTASYILFDQVQLAASLALGEFVIKTVLYWIHERIWNRVDIK